MVAGLFSLDLPNALAYSEEFPAIRKIELATGDTPELMEQVIRGHLHLGLGVQPIIAPELAVQPLAREGFCLCIPKNHGFAQRTSLAVRELGGQLIFWLSRRTHSAFHASVLEYFERLDVNAKFREVDSALHAVNAVASGVGLALLPTGAAWLSRSGVVFKSLTDRFLQIETAMFWRRDSQSEIMDPLTDYFSSRLSRLQMLRDTAK
jgi:DNA-binding transcriptional LysR family regulator